MPRKPDPLLASISELAFRRLLAGEFIETNTPDSPIYGQSEYRAIQVSTRELHIHVATSAPGRSRDFIIQIREML